jgi:DNA repair photolyase
MSIIYQPRGRAREYSPYALNYYMGCDHCCFYCFNSKGIFSYSKDYFTRDPKPRDGFLSDLKRQLIRGKIDQQVLLSFIGDPYGTANQKYGVTRTVLEMLLEHHVPVAILTKAGKNCLRDLDLFLKFGPHIKVGASLTLDNPGDSLKHEPGAKLPAERMVALKELHDAGVTTWASMEPVIYPDQALNLIRQTRRYVDHYRVGKINHFPDYEHQDWGRFTDQVIALFRTHSIAFYMKESLQPYVGSAQQLDWEVDPDHLNVK